MNKSVIAISLACVLFSAGSLAAKPESAGQGNQKAEKMKVISKADNASQANGQTEEELLLLQQQNKQKDKKSEKRKEKKSKEIKTQEQEREREEIQEHKEVQVGSTQPGMEKQAAMKSEQERKELGKGSEMGQQKREENSKKWWKFWEE